MKMTMDGRQQSIQTASNVLSATKILRQGPRDLELLLIRMELELRVLVQKEFFRKYQADRTVRR